MTFTLTDDSALFQPITIGSNTARNRLFMAPLTRSRAEADGTPSDLQAEYYVQRASAGLIISEATATSQGSNGAYVNIPGMYTDRHQQKWAEVAAAVHAQGGLMFMQLSHVGRMAHPDISGGQSVAQFRAAARRAVDAGMDGVEIHSANGDLRHEFLADATEVVETVADEIGPGRVGLRISPENSAGDVNETGTVSAYEVLLQRISPLGLAYLHVLINPVAAEFGIVRALWPGRFVLHASGHVDTSFCELENLVDWGAISAAAVGRARLSTTRRWRRPPDAISRAAAGVPLWRDRTPTRTRSW
jgi:N-ethylmaleimide reductase